MAESARHLAEEVFGPRPVRQWVLSVPVPLRFLFTSTEDQHRRPGQSEIGNFLKELAASSLDIEVMAWFHTAEVAEFQLIRQEILLQLMQGVEGAGASFAFPTRTVHVLGQKRERTGA